MKFSSFKWIDIFRTDFSKGFFGIFLISMENYTFWFENFYKKVIVKAQKKVWKMEILQIEKNIPIFSKWIDIFIKQNISIHLEKNVCDNTFFP